MRYRAKPVVVDAVMWSGGNLDEICKLLDGCAAVARRPEVMDNGTLLIHMRSGFITAHEGSYVVKSAGNAIASCDADSFRATYNMLPPT
jgi:hypothetical protein